ncbi:MAG: NmrA family NAD(P)-binding protein [Myxococcota bacterium]
MNQPLVLVTGATGKTGAPLVAQLRERGVPVRAFVRRLDERSARLEAHGAEVVRGDFLDLASLRSALSEVDRAYFCYPPTREDLVDATSLFAEAAREAGVRGVVNMSQISALEASSSPLARQHWLAEKVLDWADVGAIHIRPTFFSENLLILGGGTIATEGRLYAPYGDEKHAPVAARDIARVVANLLLDPEPHLGARLVLTGDQLRSMAEIAEVLSSELERPVEYVDLSGEVWAQALAAIPTMTPSLIAHLRAVADEYKRGVFHARTDVVDRIGGAAPTPLAEFIREHRQAFGAEASPAR